MGELFFIFIFSVLFFYFCMSMYLRLPADWFCEYDEKPGEIHMPGFRACRSRVTTAGICFLMVTAMYIFKAGALTCLTAPVLLLVSLSDRDYMIIPDQLAAALLAAALTKPAMAGVRAGFELVAAGAQVPGAARLFAIEVGRAAAGCLAGVFWGACVAGGLMALCAVVSWAIYGKCCIGMGDIRLLAVCGALTGSEAAVVFVLSVCFCAFGIALRTIAFMATRLLRRLQGRCTQTDMAEWIPAAPGICLATFICMLTDTI